MDPIRIYHNPACSKSRDALEILRGSGAGFEVVEYLKTPPSREDLARMLALIPDAPGDLVRKDGRFKALGLGPDDCATTARVIDLLLAHPKLMQRPVVLRGERALIARPPGKVEELFR